MLKVKGGEKIYHININLENTGVTMLTSNKVDTRAKKKLETKRALHSDKKISHKFKILRRNGPPPENYKLSTPNHNDIDNVYNSIIIKEIRFLI